MNASDFVKKTKKLQPKKEQLTDFFLSSKMIEDTIHGYDFKRTKNEKIYTYELLNFIKNYVPTSLEIFGGIVLLNEIKEDQHYIYFGQIELDPLVIDKKTKYIKYLEYPINRVFSDIALHDEAFLDVLYQIYNAYTQKITGKTFDECQLSIELTKISQEPSAISFYKTLVGCWK